MAVRARALGRFHSVAGSFTEFDENSLYTRQSSEEAFVYEQATFANISDYAYQIDDLRIDLFGDAEMCTFTLAYKEMFVNDYSFEGSPVGSRDRVTMAFAKTKDGWKIAHEHPNRFPEWKTPHPARRSRLGCGPGAIWTLDRPVSSGSRMSRSL